MGGIGLLSRSSFFRRTALPVILEKVFRYSCVLVVLFSEFGQLAVRNCAYPDPWEVSKDSINERENSVVLPLVNRA